MQKQKDIYDKDILINNKNEQIMMAWEKPYMEKCIDVLQPHGDVLEIGYGLGYSANQIRKHSYSHKRFSLLMVFLNIP